MGPGLRWYRWECPLCGESKQGYYQEDRKTGERTAVNALACHVKHTRDDVHGGPYALPRTFELADAHRHVTNGEEDLSEDAPVP